MIEKLEYVLSVVERDNYVQVEPNIELPRVIDKLNEVIDAVNALLDNSEIAEFDY